MHHEKTSAIGLALPLLMALSSAWAAQPPIAFDGEGDIESMEQQGMLIAGESFRVSGATIKTISPGDNGEPTIRVIGRVSGSSSIREVLPADIHWVAYDLAPGSSRRIETLWIDKRGGQ